VAKNLVIDSSEVVRNLGAMIAAMPAAKHVALAGLASRVYEEVEPVTPLGPDGEGNWGALRQSLYSQVMEGDEGVQVGTSGVDYAAAVHEGVHPPKRAQRGDVINYTTPGTDMKFIENPVNAIAEDELRKVASTTMRGMLAATRRTKKGG